MFPQSALIAFLLPLGLWLTLLASAHPKSEPRAAAAGMIALAVSALVYLAAGFGLMFGGLGALGGPRDFAELGAYFALPVEGGGWAIAGMKGFFLDGVSAGRALFVAWLPIAQACAILAAVPLWRRHSLFAVAVAAALATLAFSFVGMATWGGGAGASMASQLRLGHGPIDFGGLGIAGLVAGIFSLLITQRKAAKAPDLAESPHPLRAALGIGLTALGAAGFLAGNPLTAMPQTATSDYVIVIMTALSVASLSSLAYSMFVSRRPSIETMTSSMLAALIAVSAGAMSLPIWAAALLGFVATLSVIIGGFVWKANVDAGDAGLGVTRMLIPAAIGIVFAGIAATGVYGAGVNAIGAETYLGTRGLGISGLLPVAGGYADPGQATAQIALLLMCGAVAVMLGLPLRLLSVAVTANEAVAAAVMADTPIEASRSISPLEAPLDAPGEPPPSELRTAIPSLAPFLLHAVEAAPTVIVPVAGPVLAPPPAAAVEKRAPSLLERLRGSRPAQPPKPVGQARRVAYPVRVGGRRLILRAMPPENKPPDAAKDSDPT